MEGKQLADEELYEVSLDNHGCCNGPKTGRLRASDESVSGFFCIMLIDFIYTLHLCGEQFVPLLVYLTTQSLS